MTDISRNVMTIGSDDPILRRTGRTVGQNWQGVMGTGEGREMQMAFDVTFPLSPTRVVRFCRQPQNEVNP